MIVLLLAAFLPMLKVAAWLVPAAGLGYGDSAAAYDDERYNYVLPADLGSERLTGEQLVSL